MQRGIADLRCNGEIAWGKLDPELVAKGEQAEFGRFNKMGK